MVAGMDTWRTAISATLHCLTGCAIGEVLGMVLATWWGWGDAASIALAVDLAFFFGYLLTFVGVRRAGLDVRTAVRTALAADTRLDPGHGDRRQRLPAAPSRARWRPRLTERPLLGSARAWPWRWPSW